MSTGLLNANHLINELSTIIAGRRVLVLGYGKEGQSTYNTIRAVGGYYCLDIADSNPTLINIASDDVTIIGDDYPDKLDNYDIVFKSPGIVLPYNVSSDNYRIKSQTDVFLSVYSSQTIGITGTKGKSTVATLLHHTLKSSGCDTILAGNIGIPMFDIAPQITPESIIIVELSCHQLEYCKHSPSTAVLLNLFEDHLDHYGTFERYVQVKTNIYRYQNEKNKLYTKLKHLPITISAKSQVCEVSIADLPFCQLEDVSGVRLRGEHNLLNAAFVYDICREHGVDKEKFISALGSYCPLPHRLEFIGGKNNVDYYDDSISTTAESSICAVQSIENAKTLILGGMDRGIDYTSLVDFLLNSDLDMIIGMYGSGKRICEMFLARCAHSDSKRFYLVDDLLQAVELAEKYTPPGSACILSPASASYGDFANFEERGNVFKKLLFD